MTQPTDSFRFSEDLEAEIHRVLAGDPDLDDETLVLTEDMQVSETLLTTTMPNLPPPPRMTVPPSPAAPVVPVANREVAARPCGSGWILFLNGEAADVATSPEQVGEKITALLRR